MLDVSLDNDAVHVVTFGCCGKQYRCPGVESRTKKVGEQQSAATKTGTMSLSGRPRQQRTTRKFALPDLSEKGIGEIFDMESLVVSKRTVERRRELTESRRLSC